MDELPPLDPETLRIGMEMVEEALEKRKGRRTVSQFIAEDHTPRPYSVRLTPGELHRLRGLARWTEIEASKLARQFILEGMLRLEAEGLGLHAETPALQRAHDIKLALLRAYDLVDGLTAVGHPPSTEPTEPT